MPTLTPKLGLKKPVVNVETDWGNRLNETIDILDGTALTANISGLGNVTVTDDGGGLVTISGKLLVGKGSITLITEGSAIVISGTGGSHGSLSGLSNDDHPQYAHLSQNETIVGSWNFIGMPTISGIPVSTGTVHNQLLGLSSDDHPQYLLADGTRNVSGNLTIASGITAASGVITNSLLVGSSVVNINSNGVTVSGIKLATIQDIITISGSGRQAFRFINAVGSGTQSIGTDDYLILVSGSATYLGLNLPPISSVIGQSIRIQLPLDSNMYPNLATIDLNTQPGDLKEGSTLPAEEVFGFRLSPLASERGASYMAVGGDYGWIRTTSTEL